MGNPTGETSLSYHFVLFENCYLRSYGNEFQEFFEEIMDASFKDFSPIGLGSDGDWHTDGIMMSTDTVFQVYAPTLSKRWKSKMKKDFDGAIKKWGFKIKKWIFVYKHRTNDPAPEIHEYLKALSTQNGICLEFWGFMKLWNLVSSLDFKM